MRGTAWRIVPTANRSYSAVLEDIHSWSQHLPFSHGAFRGQETSINSKSKASVVTQPQSATRPPLLVQSSVLDVTSIITLRSSRLLLCSLQLFPGPRISLSGSTVPFAPRFGGSFSIWTVNQVRSKSTTPRLKLKSVAPQKATNTKIEAAPKAPAPRPPSLSRQPSRSRQSRDEQILRLKDRGIGFAEYGALNGRPLFSLHGTPGCRLIPDFGDSLRPLGVRLICLDRPGMGLSTFVKGRLVSDYHKDVLAVADHLGIDKFRVMGTSGGGPYALSCARFIPRARLLASGTMCGSNHPSAPWVGLSDRQYRHKHYSFFFGPLYRIWMERYRVVRHERHLRLLVERGQADLSTWRIYVETFRQGAKGYMEDLGKVRRDWGFELNEINAKVLMYAGTKDGDVSIKGQRYTRDRIRGVVYREFPEDHISIQAKHRNAFVDELMKMGK